MRDKAIKVQTYLSLDSLSGGYIFQPSTELNLLAKWMMRNVSRNFR